MNNNLNKRFLDFIRQNKLIEPNDKIVIGLSGGPDSVCLLMLLCEIKEQMNLTLVAAHVNHMFRGNEADQDEEYARQLCKKKNIPFYSLKINVSEYATREKLSSESAGRKIRYNYFNKIMKENKLNKIATAHNANDQAETILMRIMRGTGLEGLGGILPKRDEIYIRPILFMNRKEVEDYCEINQLNPRIDKTNLKPIYDRNKVRLDILPYMRDNFNKDVVDAIDRMSLLLQDDNRFIENEVDKFYKKTVIQNHEKVIIKKEAFLLDIAIVRRLIRNAIRYIDGSVYNLEMKHIQNIIKLQKLNTGKKTDISGNFSVYNQYGDIIITKIQERKECQDIILSKDEITNIQVKFERYKIKFEVINNNNIDFQKNGLIKYFDYTMIRDSITIRTRKNGDKMIPLGMNGKRKIKDIFIDMKIPKELRDTLPIIQFDDEIAWVVLVKQSNSFRITSSTRKILKITIDSEV